MQPSSDLHFVVAFIQPFQLDAVVDALRGLPSFPGMSVSDVRGFGSHQAHPPRAGEATEVHAFKAKLRIEIFCGAGDVGPIVDTIRKTARTGNRGDGKVFSGPIESAFRIRTGEPGEAALRLRTEPK